MSPAESGYIWAVLALVAIMYLAYIFALSVQKPPEPSEEDAHPESLRERLRHLLARHWLANRIAFDSISRTCLGKGRAICPVYVDIKSIALYYFV